MKTLLVRTWVIICCLLPSLTCLTLSFTMKKMFYVASEESVIALLNSIPLEGDSLMTFIQIQRYPYFPMSEPYEPAIRLPDILEGLVSKRIPSSLINDVLTFSAFIDAQDGKRLFFENLEHLKSLYTTKYDVDLEDWTGKERRELVKFITKQQQRAVYGEGFCRDLIKGLDDWIERLFTFETWEFFDWNCLEDIYMENTNKEKEMCWIMEKLVPWARKDDLALFRLASLRKASGFDENDIPPVVRYFIRKILQFGTKMQQLIVKLTLSGPETTEDALIESSHEIIKSLYGYFLELLRTRKDTSPAFLLELILITNMDEGTKLQLLGDISRKYPIEHISPVIMSSILEDDHTATKLWEILPTSWTAISKQSISLYYFPLHVLSWKDQLNIWRHFTNSLLPVTLMDIPDLYDVLDEEERPDWCPIYWNVRYISETGESKPYQDRVECLLQQRSISNVFLKGDNQYFFDCGAKLDVPMLKEFVKAGIWGLASGEFDFFQKLPTPLFELMTKNWYLEIENFLIDTNSLHYICLEHTRDNNAEGIKKLLKVFIETFQYWSIKPSIVKNYLNERQTI